MISSAHSLAPVKRERGLWERLQSVLPKGITLGEIKARGNSLYVDLMEAGGGRRRVSWLLDAWWEDVTSALVEAADDLKSKVER